MKLVKVVRGRPWRFRGPCPWTDQELHSGARCAGKTAYNNDQLLDPSVWLPVARDL